jgi:photosystem II stability/assembly factor-like uncharacterized protein
MDAMRLTLRFLVLAALLLQQSTANAAEPPAAGPAPRAARMDAHASGAAMFDATRAGRRIVAVGEHGYVLLSDDEGKTHRQARSVPVDFALTSVFFTDANNGWAAGHASVILHTVDGGENWVVQHVDTTRDQPLFSVYFRDAQSGWAAGLWSLMLATVDGGKTWTPVTLPAAAGRKKADLNLFKLFSGAGRTLFIAAEQGTVLRSNDDGASWQYLQTGSKASLWSGAAAGGNALVVAGLGGKMLRSEDGGDNWTPVAAGVEGSVTQVRSDGAVLWASSLDGRLMRSADAGLSWRAQSANGGALTALAPRADGGPVLYSKQGLVK